MQKYDWATLSYEIYQTSYETQQDILNTLMLYSCHHLLRSSGLQEPKPAEKRNGAITKRQMSLYCN